MTALLLAILGLFPAVAAERPNIVFVLTDDLDIATFEAIPELRPLLQDAGTTFDHAYVSLSLCCPSRSTTLRGQYAHTTGIFRNKGPLGGFPAFRDRGLEQSTIATWLQGAGYDTALLGKYLNDYPDPDEPRYVPPGWTHWFVPAGGNPYAGFDYVLNEDGKLRRHRERAADYMTDVLADEGKRFIRDSAARGHPFFLYLATFAPHAPETPAPRYSTLYDGVEAPRSDAWDEADVSDKPSWIRTAPPITGQRASDDDARYRRRLQSMRSVVDLVAGLEDELRKAGQLENTWIVFTSDNGYHYADHRMRAGKNTAYEPDLHVPLVVRGPGVAAGAHDDALVVNTDLAPTFAEMAGVAPPYTCDGRSWLPTLKGEAGTRRGFLIEHRGPVGPEFGAEPAPWRPVEEPGEDGKRKRQRRRKGDPEGGVPLFVGVHTRDVVYVEYADGEKELYDLAADPLQLQNRAGSVLPSELDRWHAWTDALRSCAGEGCRAAEDDVTR